MREYIINTVERTLNCENIEKGYIKHKYIECNEEYIHCFTCKSKFCSKCGTKYCLEWSDKQVDNMLNVIQRHAAFTIPEELRNYLYQKCELLKKLQDAVYKLVPNYYENKIKGNHQVGLIAVVHTSGSDVKCNTHIHGLFTEGWIDKSNKRFKKIQHIPYNHLRKSRQKLVLDIIKDNFKGVRTKRLLNRLYKTYKELFYVNSERNLTNIKRASKYIGRYLSRLAIAEYRITDYDDKSATFIVWE